MKTKTLFILCLLIGISTTKLNAQSDTRSYSVEENQVTGWFPVYCDDVHEDFIATLLDVHYMYHDKDGVIEYQISQWTGEFISSTGEVFKWIEVDKSGVDYGFHGNLIGNEGSHYIISGTINYSVRPVEVTIDKAVCLEKEKN